MNILGISPFKSSAGSELYSIYDRELGNVVLKKLTAPDMKRERERLEALSGRYLPKIWRVIEELDPASAGTRYASFLVMEKVEGQTLVETLQGGNVRFSEYDILSIGYQLAGALEEMHQSSVPYFHGKLTPHNIFFDKGTGHVTVLGLGCTGAAVYDSGPYAAPELVQRGSGAFHSTQEKLLCDIYSFGACLYALCVGGDPQRDPRTGAVEELRNLRRDLSSYTSRLIMQCLSEDPSKRIQDTKELQRRCSFQEYMRCSRPYRALEHSLRVRRLLLVTGMFFSIGLIGYGFYSVSSGRERQYVQVAEEMQSNYEAGNYEAATRLYERYEKDYGERPDFQFRQARNLFLQGSYTECTALLKRILTASEGEELSGLERNIYLLYAEASTNAKDYQSAVEYYRNLLEEEPGNLSLLVSYAVVLARMGDLEEAIEVLNQARASGLSSDLVLYELGEIYYAAGEYEEAEKAFRDCLLAAGSPDRRRDAYLYVVECIEAAELKAGKNLEVISTLEDARKDLTSDHLKEINARLLRAYADQATESEDETFLKEGLKLFREMEGNRSADYSDAYYLAVHMIEMNDTEDADRLLSDMGSSFGERYQTYIALAINEYNRLAKEKEADYTSFMSYYKKAEKLKKQQAPEAMDSQMQLLQEIAGTIEEE